MNAMDCQEYYKLLESTYKEPFEQFYSLLTEYNEKVNLTAITERNDVKIKHFLDSVLGEFAFVKGARAVEIGSGGGFPSVPLKIVREDITFTLVESTGKKCEFLREVVDKLGLRGVQVLNIRAEEGGKDAALRERFDVACARAVARLNTLCEYCMPFVRVGGAFVAYKGEAAEEIKEAENAVKVLGGKIEEIREFDLPGGAGRRNVIVIRKVKPTPAQYPRGNGRERKRPL